MSLVPTTRPGYCSIKGLFSFRYEDELDKDIIFEIEIQIRHDFPDWLRKIYETKGEIPKEADSHVFGNGSLCLGNPIRLFLIAGEKSKLEQYIEACLVPYLYAIRRKLRYGGKFIFGELNHGNQAIIEDCKDLFNVGSEQQVLGCLKVLISDNKKVFDEPCPCGCGKKLGACSFRKKLRKVRNSLPNAALEWIKEELCPL